MSFYLIHASSVATLGADDPVIAAADLAELRAATDALVEAARLRDGVMAASEAAAADARAAAQTAGHAEGIAAAAEEVRNQLFDLSLRASGERQRLRAEVSRLAIEVVRRIAAEVGPPDMVAAIAERAAADLLPDASAVVRVHPDAAAPTTERLRGFTGLTVVGDAALAADDCLFETPLGVSHAGLDIQLAAVERAWAAAQPEAGDAR